MNGAPGNTRQQSADATKEGSDEMNLMIEINPDEYANLVMAKAALGRLVNLSQHPLFHEQTELVAWDGAVDQARRALAAFSWEVKP